MKDLIVRKALFKKIALISGNPKHHRFEIIKSTAFINNLKSPAADEEATETVDFLQVRSKSESEVNLSQHDPAKKYLRPLLLLTFEASTDRELIALNVVRLFCLSFS